MKKNIILLFMLLTLFTACDNRNTNQENINGDNPNITSTVKASPSTIAQNEKVSDYFSIAKDTHMKYKGIGNEYAQYDLYVEYVSDTRLQLKKINGGTDTVAVYQLTDDMIKQIYSKGEVYYRYDFTELSNMDEIILKAPIAVGTKWNLSDGSSRSITAVDKDIKTQAGDFKALEVTTIRKESTQKNYYVKEVGLVRSDFNSNGSTDLITSELEIVEKGVSYNQTIRFYFPEFSKERIVYIDRNVDINSNQDMKFKFQKELKTIPSGGGLSAVLTKNTQILSCKVDDSKGIVTVDLSSDFIKEMNAGSSFESMLLKSITNTFGGYYGVTKVIITVGGKPYSSGHILMGTGEYFTVENKGIKEYKQS